MFIHSWWRGGGGGSQWRSPQCTKNASNEFILELSCANWSFLT